jgi:hypothetical protein
MRIILYGIIMIELKILTQLEFFTRYHGVITWGSLRLEFSIGWGFNNTRLRHCYRRHTGSLRRIARLLLLLLEGRWGSS